MSPERSAILRGVQGGSARNPVERAVILTTARLILTPLALLDEAEHAQASGDAEDARRDTQRR
jgi:hypothetical protein